MTALSDLSPIGSDYPAPMRREDWAARLTDVIAGQVRRYREARGMTAQQVVDACIDLGLPMKRSVLVNLEHGRRGNVNVAELLALAHVLRVPPLLLVFPVGIADRVEVLPGHEMGTWEASQWFTGESSLLIKGEDGNFYATGLDRFQASTWILKAQREHDRLVNEWRTARSRLESASAAVDAAPVDQRATAQSAQEAWQLAVGNAESSLRRQREYIRREGYQPTGLPADLIHVDDGISQ